MGHLIDFPPPRRRRVAAEGDCAQILLFTGVWRERYDAAPAIWSRGKRGAAPKKTLAKDGTKDPSAPGRGKKRA